MTPSRSRVRIDRIDLDHPAATAVGKPVFEIFPIESGR